MNIAGWDFVRTFPQTEEHFRGEKVYNPYDVIASRVLELAVKDWNAVFFGGGDKSFTSDTDLGKAEELSIELGFEGLGDELICFFRPGNSHCLNLLDLVLVADRWERYKGRLSRRVGYDDEDIRQFINYEACKKVYLLNR